MQVAATTMVFHVREFRKSTNQSLSLVDRNGMKSNKHNQNGGTQTCIVRGCCSCVDSCNFTNEANSRTPKLKWKRYARHKLCHSDHYVAQVKPSSKAFRPSYPGWSVHMGKFSSRLPRSWSQKRRSR